MLFGSSKAHRTLRRILVEEQKLDAVVSMPSGVFRPYAGVSTALLLFTKTNSGGTDDVWFYDMQADGYSLDDKRTPQPDNSDLADILARWQQPRRRSGKRARTDRSFLVPTAEIAGNDYDLSINRYKEVELRGGGVRPAARDPGSPGAALEAKIATGLAELEGIAEMKLPVATVGDVCEVDLRSYSEDRQSLAVLRRPGQRLHTCVTPKHLDGDAGINCVQTVKAHAARKSTTAGLQSCSTEHAA